MAEHELNEVKVATEPICTPLTLTGAPTLSPFRSPRNMHMNRIGLRNSLPEPTTTTAASIRLRLSPTEGQLRQGVEELRLPVILDIDRSQITALGGALEAVGQSGFNDLVKRGLRAQLQTESLLTGLLYIDLDLHPGTPIDFNVLLRLGNLQLLQTNRTMRRFE
jgi:hypothetical protein